MKSNNTSSNSAYMLILLILLILVSCRERVIPPDNGNGVHVPKLKIEAEDIGVTDCFIRLKFLDTSNVEAKIFLLTRDGQTILTSQCSSLDTLILDEGLLPKRAYTYKAFLHNSNNPSLQSPVDSCAPLLIITMDTTSHNFSWEITYLGDGASSVLYDVFILNDTLAYAVGEIYKKDSSGNFETEPYGVAKWNGKEWKLIRLYAVAPQGYNSVIVPHGVFVFSESNIWFVGGGVFKWNGSSQYVTAYWINTFPGNPNPIWTTGQYARKLWGTSNNLYVVGTNGALAHFNGSSWRRLESPEGASVTDQTINDVWGVQDPKTNEQFILAGASNVYNPGYIKLLQIKISGYVDTIPWISQDRRISSVWFKNQNRLYTAGGGVFNRLPNKKWREFTEIPLIFTNRIRGTSNNDVFVVGDFGIVSHWNGMSWKLYPEVAAALYYSCDYKNNILVAVGERNARAVALIMRKR